ncbi:hypothetical protein C1632_08045 [Microbacterium testaceum]|uniref:hypothetical protein n=1 Tax=Microbacterium testaceum TaxID=2033 RepID=UPI000CCE5994|nr:hypothetical protein [Microbacterium testaceum]PNW09038.1 hypothetical protein C1632_08045 [Microbacterium testaceum]
MTLVVGAVDQHSGAVHIAGDTKIWWMEDETKSRRIYTDPALKVILLAHDLAVGYAGEGPETIAREASKFRGRELEPLLEGLANIRGASFLLARRNPGQLWKVADGEWGEVSNEGLALIGDDEVLDPTTTVFDLVRRRYDDFPTDPAAFRLQSTMQHLVHLVRPKTIGGFVVMASASNETAFRYAATASTLFDAIHVPGPVEWPVALAVLPGAQHTPGALGLWMENAGVGHLFCDGEPADPRPIVAASVERFLAVASEDFSQSLIAPDDPVLSVLERH